jgi:hypothetical protein
MLPFSMFSSQFSQSSYPPPAFPVLCAPSPSRCKCGASAPRLFPRFCSGGSSDPCFFSSLHPTPPIPKPFTMCSSAKRACNPCRMRSFKTQDLKPFRMCSSEKKGCRGVGLSTVTLLCAFSTSQQYRRPPEFRGFPFNFELSTVNLPSLSFPPHLFRTPNEVD